MPVSNLRVLIVEDSPEDRTVIRFMLEEAPARTWQFLEEEKGVTALERLEHEQVDCILLDYYLPDMNAVRFLKELSQRFGPLRFPVVVFTGSGRASLAQQSLAAGAQDYLSKDLIRVDTLVRAIDNSIKQVSLLLDLQKQQGELDAANGRLSMLEAALREIYAPILITDAETRIVFVNQAFTALTGYAEADVLGKTPKVFNGPKTSRQTVMSILRSLVAGRAFFGQTIHYRKDGSELTLDLAILPSLGADGRPTHYVASQCDGASGAAIFSARRGTRMVAQSSAPSHSSPMLSRGCSA